MTDIKIISPLAVYLPRKTMLPKKYILNKNNERNWYFLLSNKIKQAYKAAVEAQLRGLTLTPPISLNMTYYKPTARRSDRANVLCIHEKFFCDALVECGCMDDDSDEYIVSTHYFSGGILSRMRQIVPAPRWLDAPDVDRRTKAGKQADQPEKAGVNKGDSVLVRFSVRGREWQGRWFTEASGFYIAVEESGSRADEATPVEDLPLDDEVPF